MREHILGPDQLLPWHFGLRPSQYAQIPLGASASALHPILVLATIEVTLSSDTRIGSHRAGRTSSEAAALHVDQVDDLSIVLSVFSPVKRSYETGICLTWKVQRAQLSVLDQLAQWRRPNAIEPAMIDDRS
jgi:hypothetical protein